MVKLKKVLEEASVVAEQKMNNIYPELPLPETEEKEKTIKEQPLLATPQEEIEEVINKIPIEELEEQVLAFIKSCDGELSLKDCAINFKVPLDDVKKAIERLENSNKIKIG